VPTDRRCHHPAQASTGVATGPPGVVLFAEVASQRFCQIATVASGFAAQLPGSGRRPAAAAAGSLGAVSEGRGRARASLASYPAELRRDATACHYPRPFSSHISSSSGCSWDSQEPALTGRRPARRGRQRRPSYQPRASVAEPWVCRLKTILSAESATHGHRPSRPGHSPLLVEPYEAARCPAREQDGIQTQGCVALAQGWYGLSCRNGASELFPMPRAG